MAEVVSVNISEKRGTVKHEVDEIKLIVNYGIEGDAHAGNWHRQISLLAEESIDTMRGRGMELINGAFAENINTVGIDLKALPVGTIMNVGECVLEVTQIGKECHDGCAIRQLVGQCIMPREGIFCRVIEGGKVYENDGVEVI